MKNEKCKLQNEGKALRTFCLFHFALFIFHFLICDGATSAAHASEKPNVVFILCDNLGYGDVGPFGNTVHRTPNLDRLAAEGRKFTHYYSASGICSPSRAALMTGCYPLRVGLHRNSEGNGVLRPMDQLGIAAEELTLGEMFQSQGYATTAIGKWHLGDQPPFLPTKNGFDSYFGIPYSEDMTEGKRPGWPPLPLLRGEKVVEAPPDRDLLMQRYTAEATKFIADHREQPFFLYFPTVTPGSEKVSFASPAFRDRSKNGRYGDAVEELDWSVGEMLKAIEQAKIADRTIVVWTSDNGAVRRDPPQGSNAPLGGMGYSTNEGGMRMPLIVRWPGRVPAKSECAELTTMMDWLPTFAALTGATLPNDRTIDGRDIRPLLFDEPGAKSPHRAFYFYQSDQLQAVRAGRWKLHLPLERSVRLAKIDGTRPAALYDVVSDPAEANNVIADHADVVGELTKLADEARSDIGDLEQPGRNVRKPGWVESPVPLVMP